MSATSFTFEWFFLGASVAAQETPAPAAGGAADRVAALKQGMQEGLAKIRQYEWIETTIISLKGEAKGVNKDGGKDNDKEGSS